MGKKRTSKLSIDVTHGPHYHRYEVKRFGMTGHWEIEYRKIIGIYRNFNGKLLHSYFTTISVVFLELMALL
jgi:hypothetical protein